MSYDQVVSSLATNVLITITTKSVDPVAKFGEKVTEKIKKIFQELENQDNKRYNS
jgi:hypothetical protein